MPRINALKLEEEMRRLAEQRVQNVAGDAPMLTRKQLAEIWNQAPGWVAKMQAAGRVPVVPFGRRTMSPRAAAVIGLVKGI